MDYLSEFTIIGGLIVYPETYEYIKIIKPEYFKHPILLKLFKVIHSIWNKNLPVTLESIKVEIDYSNELSYDLDVEEAIKKAIKSAYPINRVFVEDFIKKAKLDKAQIYLSKLVQDISISSYNEFIGQLDLLTEELRETGYENLIEFGPNLFLSKRIELLKRRESIDKVIFGIPPLDQMILGGLNKKEISVIAGRPAMGKSLAKANLIKIQCDLGYKVASLATEQTAETETDRMDSLITGIPLSDIINSREWKDGDPRFKQIIEANKKIDKEWAYFLLVNRNFGIQDLRRWLDRLVNKYGELDILYIDLFDKLKDVNVSNNKASVVSQKLGELNRIAEEFNIHISLLVQINRELKHVRGHRPQIWHIKDSGAYEEVARLILLLHREKYYNPQIRENILEINIAKQSNGPAGSNVIVPLTLNEKTLKLDWQIESLPNIF